MKFKWVGTFLILIISIVLIGNNAMAGEWKPEIKFIKFGTGSSGGIWYPQGAMISDTINKTMPPLIASVAPGGAISNIWKLDRNELQLAYTYTYLEGLAWQGKDAFERPHRNIRHVGSAIPSMLTMVVRADSGINKIEDLKDKKIVPGQKGFISELLARRILEAHGITYKQIVENGGLISYLSYKEGAALLQDKHTDCVVLMAQHPASLLMGLATQTKIKLLGIEENMMNKILRENKGVIAATVPDKPGTYEMDKVVPAIGGPTVLLCHKDLSEELVYRITKIYYDKMPEITKSISKAYATVTPALLDLGAAIPLHPGAERYFKEWKKEHGR